MPVVVDSRYPIQFSKYAAETYPQAIDFAERLPDGTTISSGAAVAWNKQTGQDATGDVLGGGTTIISGTRSIHVVKNGTPGTVYVIAIRVTLSDSSLLEERLEMQVL